MNERYERQLKKGILEILVLQLLLKEKMYGYQMILCMKEKSQGMFEMKEGTLYPILYRLEDDGLVESQWSVPQNKEISRKYYCLTEKGKEQLKALKLLWKRYVKAVDEILGYPGAFNEKICSELDSLSEKEATNNRTSARIRCPRGKAVMTKGYGFCDYIIHVVGSRYDGKDVSKSQSFKKQRRVFGTCSSSRIKTLESCYYEIINIVKKHPDIKNVAIPIVGSGEYKFTQTVEYPNTGDVIGRRFVEGTTNNIYGTEDIITYSIGKYRTSLETPTRKPGKEGNANEKEAYILSYYGENDGIDSDDQKAMYTTDVSSGNITWDWEDITHSEEK